MGTSASAQPSSSTRSPLAQRLWPPQDRQRRLRPPCPPAPISSNRPSREAVAAFAPSLLQPFPGMRVWDATPMPALRLAQSQFFPGSRCGRWPAAASSPGPPCARSRCTTTRRSASSTLPPNVNFLAASVFDEDLDPDDAQQNRRVRLGPATVSLGWKAASWRRKMADTLPGALRSSSTLATRPTRGSGRIQSRTRHRMWDRATRAVPHRRRDG